MPTFKKPTPTLRLLRLVIGIVFVAASVKNFADHQTVLGILFLVIGVVFAGAAAVRFNSHHRHE